MEEPVHAMAAGPIPAPIDDLLAFGPLLLRRCLCAFGTLREVLASQVACRRWRHAAQDGKWVKHCVLCGTVTAGERRSLWWRFAGVKEIADRWCAALSPPEGDPLDISRGFAVLAGQSLEPSKVSEIERDVHRTFPTHPKFRGDEGEGARAELLKVLRAVVAAEPEVGYCQGMNFVAATLLIHLGNARDAFWVLLAMIEGCHFRHVFAPGVPLLPLRVFQFSGVVRERLPRLWRHLKDETFSLDIFAHQCVLTLFAYSIEPDFLVHVYDIFFLLGWKAVFRIGLGLLSQLEARLLEMSIEDISRFMHQCKRHFSPGDASGGDLQATLEGLLKFKVSRATLDELQHAFQLERWEVLLKRACDDSCASSEPLPPGLERSPGGEGFLLDANAFRTENTPPWRSPGASPVAAAVLAADGPQVVPLEALQSLKAALDDFDAETQRDVSLLRARVTAAEGELALRLRESEALREEVHQAELERQEWHEYKRALMDSLQAAVKTSPSVRAEERRSPREEGAAHNGHHPARPGQDVLVLQCMEKVKKVESSMFELSARWQAKAKELEPVAEQIQDLREVKARSMGQLSDFLEARTRARQALLEAGLYEVLPGARLAPSPAAPRRGGGD